MGFGSAPAELAGDGQAAARFPWSSWRSAPIFSQVELQAFDELSVPLAIFLVALYVFANQLPA
jgi:hypothetical protein